MIHQGALAPGVRIADLRIEACIAASPLGFEYLARADGDGAPCRLLEYLPAGLAERRGLQVSVRSGAAAVFDVGRRAFQLDADRFSLRRDDALAVVQRLLVEHGTAYLQMPWHDGPTLADEYRAGREAEPDDVRRWLVSLGRALGRLHRGGMVHGAVSAVRVRRRADGRVVLGAPESARWALAASLPGLIDATDPSLAPEQLLDPIQRARALGPWTDVYGLATIAHLAIAGELPPPAHDWRSALARPSLARFAGERWSAAMLVAIDRALSPDPASRPRTMDDFLAAMGLLERQAPPRAEATEASAPPAVPEQAPRATPTQSWHGSSPRWRWAVALLFSALAALAIWAALRPGAAAARGDVQRPSEMPVSEAVRNSG
ncbi:hypothetical protein [Piscinibacter sp.]|uniref:hypothetical protein n=1 Tax=Piscinibacter sp. TaxID=1903157 RepID=UPI0039E6718D